MGAEPAVDEAAERGGEAARRDGRDPVEGRELVEYRAVARHQIGAEARRAPVDGDQRRGIRPKLRGGSVIAKVRACGLFRSD